jgi:hypothetical protein
VTRDSQEAQEAPDDDWRTLSDDIQCIRAGMDVMFSKFVVSVWLPHFTYLFEGKLGGQLTGRSGTFPWKGLPKELARHRFVMAGYPEDTLMPGEPRATVARSKGISDLDKREQRVLADAMRSGKLVIQRQKQVNLGSYILTHF